jgi:hypothetical protein
LVDDAPIFFVNQKFNPDTTDYQFEFEEADCAIVPVRYSSPAYRSAHQPVVVCKLKKFPWPIDQILKQSLDLTKRYSKYKVKAGVLPRLRQSPTKATTVKA